MADFGQIACHSSVKFFVKLLQTVECHSTDVRAGEGIL